MEYTKGEGSTKYTIKCEVNHHHIVIEYLKNRQYVYVHWDKPRTVFKYHIKKDKFYECDIELTESQKINTKEAILKYYKWEEIDYGKRFKKHNENM